MSGAAGRGPERPNRRWPRHADELDAEQVRLAGLAPPPWGPPAGPWRVGGCFLAFALGAQGPGAAGDRGWCGAVVVEVPGFDVVAEVVTPVVTGAPYDRGRLALREGPALADAIGQLATPPDVVLVDATGRDHPRRAGLALHVGAVLDRPSIGVTHRTLLARGAWPGPEAGAMAPLVLDDVVVGAWLRTVTATRPVAVHAGWRTAPDVAVEVVRRCVARARTPEPLRQARVRARTARARAEGRGL